MLSKQTENSNNTISELNKWEIANTVSTVINALLSSMYVILTKSLWNGGTIIIPILHRRKQKDKEVISSRSHNIAGEEQKRHNWNLNFWYTERA